MKMERMVIVFLFWILSLGSAAGEQTPPLQCRLESDGWAWTLLLPKIFPNGARQAWPRDCGPFPIERVRGRALLQCDRNGIIVYVRFQDGSSVVVQDDVPELKTLCGSDWVIRSRPGLLHASPDFPDIPPDNPKVCVTYTDGNDRQTDSIELSGIWSSFRAEQWLKKRVQPYSLDHVAIDTGSCPVSPRAGRKLTLHPLALTKSAERRLNNLGVRDDRTVTLDERCIISWDDSHGFHKFDSGGRMITKSLRHCVKLTTIGPLDASGVVNAVINKCEHYALEHDSTRHAIELIAAFGADYYCPGCFGGSAVTAKLTEYVGVVVDNFVSCISDREKVEGAIVAALKDQFDAKITTEAHWVYSDD